VVNRVVLVRCGEGSGKGPTTDTPREPNTVIEDFP
jgi:hypothetical protein